MQPRARVHLLLGQTLLHLDWSVEAELGTHSAQTTIVNIRWKIYNMLICRFSMKLLKCAQNGSTQKRSALPHREHFSCQEGEGPTCGKINYRTSKEGTLPNSSVGEVCMFSETTQPAVFYGIAQEWNCGRVFICEGMA